MADGDTPGNATPDEAPEWLTRQRAAIAIQRKAHADIYDAARTYVLGDITYTRGQFADYLAQLRNVLEHGTLLPNAGEHGLTVDPDVDREALDDKARDDYAAILEQYAGEFTDDENADADRRLAENLANGVTLDPRTAES